MTLLIEYWLLDPADLLGISELPMAYGSSRIYYCTVCGKVYAKSLTFQQFEDIEKLGPYTAHEGTCFDCKPSSRWSCVPGAIPRFYLLPEPIPHRVIEHQFNCELSYMESLCPTTPISHLSTSQV